MSKSRTCAAKCSCSGLNEIGMTTTLRGRDLFSPFDPGGETARAKQPGSRQGERSHTIAVPMARQEVAGNDGCTWSPPGREGCRLLHRAGGDGAIYADGRSW